MGTLGGFPNPPALWLRRAKPGYAYASAGYLVSTIRPSPSSADPGAGPQVKVLPETQ
jgi:hypothetical protein